MRKWLRLITVWIGIVVAVRVTDALTKMPASGYTHQVLEIVLWVAFPVLSVIALVWATRAVIQEMKHPQV